MEKYLAEKGVKDVRGVKGVANDLKVNLFGQKERSDTDIARAAIHALEWDAWVPEEDIKVTVENGIVTLTGHVPYYYQRKNAFSDVCNLQGVRNVINNIIIKPTVNPLQVKEKITKEFERNARIDAEHVNVSVEKTKVILKGKVRSWAEHEEAARAAWSIPGVTQVDNQIRLY